MRVVFTTDSVDAKHRFAYWCDLVCDVFVNIECLSGTPHSFNARMQHGIFGPTCVVAAENDAIQAVRSRKQIARGREDDFLVVIQSNGRTALEQEGQRSILSEGDFAVLDTARPYRLEFSDDTSTVWLQCSRVELLSRVRTIRPYLAKTMPGDSGTAAIFSVMARSLGARMMEFDACEAGESEPSVWTSSAWRSALRRANRFLLQTRGFQRSIG